MKTYTDEELREYVYELKWIIRKLLFQPLEGDEHFKNNIPEESKREILDEYIYEQIDLLN